MIFTLRNMKTGEVVEVEAKKEGKGYRALCPFHPDTKPSLCIYPEGNFYCFGCNAVGKVIDDKDKAKGVQDKSTSYPKLTLKEFSLAKNLPLEFLSEHYVRESEKGLVFYYMPEDPNGAKTQIRYRHCMEGEQRFSWERGSKPTLYGLWKIKDFKMDQPLFIVEGESDALTLWYAGFQALGVPGVNAWKKSWGKYIREFKIIVVAVEPNTEGILFKKVKESIKGNVVVPFNFEELDYEDFSDAYLSCLSALDEHFDLNDIKDAVEKFKDWTQKTLQDILSNIPIPKYPSEIETKTVDWVIPGYFARGVLSLVAGPAGIGKTTFALYLLSQSSQGGYVPTASGFVRCKPMNWLYISCEDDLSSKVLPTYYANGGTGENKNTRFVEVYNFADIQSLLLRETYDAVIIDPLSTVASIDINDAGKVSQMLSNLVRLAKKKNASIVIVWHLNKSQEILGSVHFKNIPKVIWKLQKDDEKNIIVENIKNAFAPLDTPLKMHIDKTGALNFIGVEELPREREDRNLKNFIINIIKEAGGSITVSELKKIAQIEGFNFSSVRSVATRLASKKLIYRTLLKEQGKIKDGIWSLSMETDKKCSQGENQAKSRVYTMGTLCENKDKNFLQDEKPLIFNNLGENEKRDAIFNKSVSKEQTVENQSFSPWEQVKSVPMADGLIYEVTPDGSKFAHYSYYYDAPNWGDGDADEEEEIKGATIKGVIGSRYVENLIKEKHKDQIPEEAPPLDKFLSFLKYQAQKHQERLGILPSDEPFEMTWAFD